MLFTVFFVILRAREYKHGFTVLEKMERPCDISIFETKVLEITSLNAVAEQHLCRSFERSLGI